MMKILNKNLIKNIVLTGTVAAILFYFPLLFLGKDTIISLTKEDAFYESVTALFFLAAAIMFLFDFLKAKNTAGKRNLFFLLFALAFFFAAGEEISWGQRIFHFGTPAALEGANAQGEFNLHNLTVIQHEHGLSASIKALLNFNRLFIVFYVVYAILIPLVNHYSNWFSRLFARIRLPIVSLWFGGLFVFNEIICKILDMEIIARLHFNSSVEEVKEALWALIILLMAVYFLYQRISSEVRIPREAPAQS